VEWACGVTREGIERSEDVAPDEKIAQWSARKFAAFILVGVICAAALFGYQVFRAKPTAAPEPVAEKSIAVLPLVNQSGDASQEYFSDGLSEELINVLGQIRELRVIGRNSSFRFKGKTDDSRVIR